MNKKSIEETFSQAGKLAHILVEYADLIDRFPLELSPMIIELKDKTTDKYHLEELLKSYTSIVEKHGEIANKLTKLLEESKKTQLELNPDKFNRIN